MDAFESVVATILEREGFWVRTSFNRYWFIGLTNPN